MTRVFHGALVALLLVACERPSVLDAPDAATTFDGGETSDGGALDGGGPIDAGTGGGVTFRLTFVSDIPETLYLQESGLAGETAWLTVGPAAGGAYHLDRPCDRCACDQCTGCGVCGAALPVVAAVESGGAFESDWNGRHFPSDTCGGGTACYRESAAPPGDFVARYCFAFTATGVGIDQTVGPTSCLEVPFTLPDPDGVVMLPVDHGG